MSTKHPTRSKHQPMAKAAGHGKAALIAADRVVVIERENGRMSQIPVEGCDPTGVPDW